MTSAFSSNSSFARSCRPTLLRLRPRILRCAASLLQTILLAGALIFPAALPAQVPHLLNYQGRVTSGGQNFSGTGQFKFALINANATTAYWKNDGPPGNILVPPFGISIPVQNGHYSVQLGDTAITNMQALPPEVFTQHSDVRLRVWFSDGVHGFQALVPDQRLAAVGYAIMAEDVKNGAITAAKMASGAARDNLAAGGLTAVPRGGTIFSDRYQDSDLLNAGYVGVGSLETHAEDTWVTLPSAPERRHSHTMIYNGGEALLAWGGFVQPPAGGAVTLSNTGVVYRISERTWSSMTLTGAPSARSRHTGLEISNKLYVWGGFGTSAFLGDGGFYSAGINQWTAIPATPALTARRDHSAVASLDEMIIFGGETSTGVFSGTGARFDTGTSTWTQLPIGPGSPGSRARHTAVMIQGKMIVWGGQNSGGVLNTGSLYDPAANTWSAMSTSGAPAARAGHLAQIAEGKVYIWGGENAAGTPVAGGGIYDVATNTWTAMNPTGAPSPRSKGTFSFAGTRLLAWGGQNGITYYGGTESVYSRYNNDWSPTSSSNTPAVRSRHAAANNYSNRVFIFGGANGVEVFNDLHVWIPRRVMYLYERP